MNEISRILVVDDEADLESLMRQKFRRKIRKEELFFDFAQNGEIALEIIKDNPNIHLVVTDINMPVMDGLTLLKKIGELNNLIRVIVMSAYGDMDNIRSAMNLGAFDFITKPVDFSDLEITIGKAALDLSVLLKGQLAEENLEIATVEKELAEEKALIAEQSKKFKEQFLANMSHEIRTPMNAVMGMSNLLLKTTLTADQLKYLNAIKQSSDHLLVIINDILDLSKIEAGKLEFESTELSMEKVLDGLTNTMLFKTDDKNLSWKTEISPDVPIHLIGDPVRLNQVLINLAGNAIKFTEEGGITVKVDLIEKDDKQAHLKFQLIDTGIGIPEDKLDSIFESFSQAEDNTTRKFGGTGLGLTISKQLIELQGGQIGVESDYGKGTTFYFDLLFSINTNIKETAETEINIDISDVKLDRLKILLVEDNDFNQMVAQDTLEDLFDNIELEIAENGQIALDKVKESDYDLILMDVNMPVMDGLTATKAIRNLDAPKNATKIMAMTASAVKEEVDKCFEAGMDEYIAKPFVPEDLKEKIIKTILSKNKSSNSKSGKVELVLIVDDNDFNRMVAEDTLRDLFPDIEIDSANNGQEAIDKLKVKPYDIILMDINMPVMDGHKATKFIRSQLNEPLNNTPIMAMTASDSKNEIDKCMKSGMNDFIAKPFEPSLLKEKINNLVKK